MVCKLYLNKAVFKNHPTQDLKTNYKLAEYICHENNCNRGILTI